MTSAARILGIDPGLTGAVALYAAAAPRGLQWTIEDLPTIGDGAQRRINAPELRDLVKASRPDACYIESVAAFPGQGVSSMFRFGRAVGAIEAIIATCDVPIHYVVPQSWKKFYGLRGSDKEQSRAMALRRWPTESNRLQRKLDHGRAEAMLIAAYGAAATGAVSAMSPLDLGVQPFSDGPLEDGRT